MSRWQGPATVVEIKSPYSYLVELDGGQRRTLHANRLRLYHTRVNKALVNNCAIVYDADEDFGSIPIVECKSVPDAGELLPSQRVDPSKVEHLTEQHRHD